MPGRPGIGAFILLAIAVAILLFGGEDETADEEAELPASIRAEVVRVIDGDTIEVSLDGETEDVRYIGVDTPETVKPGSPVECFGPRASAFNHRLVEGREVRLVFDAERRDDYGRLLAYVHVAGRFVNAELVREGYARTLTIEPNTAHAAELARLEDRAGGAGRGLWSSC